ncbi:tRNA (adenosine(37)-N6)-threonylcarbamoyltransferase complex ATPase subunit type 1 TsaE [Silvibacterium sp.]|uniref:tRNA (adenosine(37)-N6)-threonylcarbamoyltransferase complex ATPase subunit type 1 TsaE n=1 Tax=Silvibacterium sp. TaxID=1964179 RepID=UPI0039E5F839
MTTTENAKAEAVAKAAGVKTYEFTTTSAAETIAAGHKIAALLTPPKFLILRGDLGAGKTTLVKGIAEALNAADPDEVTSPTFTLIHEYEGEYKGAHGGGKTPVDLYHLDLYRIEGERQLDTLGLDDLATPDSIVLVEWGEKFPSVIRRSDGEIVMSSTGGDARKIVLTLK